MIFFVKNFSIVREDSNYKYLILAYYISWGNRLLKKEAFGQRNDGLLSCI